MSVLAEGSDRIVLPPAGEPVPGAGEPAVLEAGAGLAEQVPDRLEGVQW